MTNLQGLFSEDTDYKKFINDYQANFNRLKKMNEQGIYSKQTLSDANNYLRTQVIEFANMYYHDQKEKIESELKQTENEAQKIGIAERPDDTKEFELKFNLADEHELKDMANNLNTTDILELSLLRQELRKRNMMNEDKHVKHYMIVNQLNAPEGKKDRLNELNQKLAILNTVKSNGLYIDGTFKTISTIEKELNAHSQNSSSASLKDTDIKKLFA
ncbi:hypothetical protein [Piscibacillus halophilus]|uniref:hypothetical protein n=1 Tax=Piscibacillus halophilus TaxID=571933 RepID=UPI001588771A|nr:hypothetical protein [Piscibacillus halophilus]